MDPREVFSYCSLGQIKGSRSIRLQTADQRNGQGASLKGRELLKQIPPLRLRITQEDNHDISRAEQQYIRKCEVFLKLDECMFSKLQRERFLYLVGPRYNEKTGEVKFSVRQFTEWEHNYNRAVEMVTETLMEAYRAPQDEPN